MKKFLLLPLVILFGCDAGDIGSSSSNSTFNPDPVECRTECTVNEETGAVTAVSQCTGSSAINLPSPSLDDCDFIEEVSAEDDGEVEVNELFG